MFPLVDNNPPKFISPSTLEVSDNFFTPNGICHFFFPVIVENEVILPYGGTDAKLPYLSKSNCQSALLSRSLFSYK